MESNWKEFCESWLADEPDVLTVLEIKRITGYCKSSVQGWIDRGLITAYQTRRSNKIPKQSNLSECDGFKDNHPYIIAIDFNIKRILRALKQIEKFDAKSEPRICCFPFQKKTMFKLLSKYDAPKSLVVSLDKNNIYDIVLGSVPKPPKQKPYMTKESEYINANQRKPAKADIKEFKS